MTRKPTGPAPAALAEAQKRGVSLNTDAGAVAMAAPPALHSSRKTASGTSERASGRLREAARIAAMAASETALAKRAERQASDTSRAWGSAPESCGQTRSAASGGTAQAAAAQQAARPPSRTGIVHRRVPRR